MNCDEIREQLELYALDALDDSTRAQVEKHLVGCVECRQLAEAYATIVHQLPSALSVVSPLQVPADLKAQVMHLAQSSAPTDVLKHQIGKRRQVKSRNLLGIGYAATILILMISLALIVHLSAALAQEQALRVDLMTQTELIFEVIDSEQTMRAVLLPPDDNPATRMTRPYGKIFTRQDMPYVVAMTGRLPQPDAGDKYQLWLINDQGQSILAGQLMPDDKGFSSLVYQADQDGPAYQSARLVVVDSAGKETASVLVWSGES